MSTSRSEADAKRPRGRPGKARPALFQAATREFAEKGYEGATTSSIARRARSKQPLVHHHFGSKEALFRLVLDTLFEELHQAMWPAAGAPSDAAALVRRFVLFTAEHPELPRIWIIESARRGRHTSYILEHHIRPLTERLQPLVAASTRAHILPDVDPLKLLYAVQGLASYPFLVPAQVKRLSGMDASSREFANAYADVVLAVLFRR
jgi:TetR/AcrR family transcriptional regulator